MHYHSFRFEPADCFWSKLITVLELITNLLRWIQEPHNISDEALCNNCERLNR